MSGPAQNLETLERGVLAPAIEQKVFSAYQLTAGCGKDFFSLAGGVTTYWPDARPVDKDTLFDIGSVTKAVVTTTLVGLALDEKKLTLDRALGDLLPDLAPTPFASISVAALLSHSAGLVPWLPLFREPVAPHASDELRHWFARNAARCFSADKAPAYSDLGFLLLGLVLETVYQESLQGVFQARVAKPLGLKRTGYGIGPTPVLEVAATEYCLWRKRVLQGTVFDENAAALGFPAGHAGLFSTTEDLARWAIMWCDAVSGRAALLSGATAKKLAARVSNASTWALGWDTRSREGSSAGTRFSPSSFGHLGYPGCSVWIDPSQGIWALFFTNRIHPSRVDERIRDLRPRVHDAIHAYWSERKPA